jgi:hypothetical protein
MRWALFARIGERFSKLRRGNRSLEPHEIPVEFSAEELAEFLEADLHPNDSSPEFRERLREDLWELVQALRSPKSGDGR